MAHHTKTEADKEYVQSSKKMWDNFTKFALYGTIHVVAILVIMALTLL